MYLENYTLNNTTIDFYAEVNCDEESNVKVNTEIEVFFCFTREDRSEGRKERMIRQTSVTKLKKVCCNVQIRLDSEHKKTILFDRNRSRAGSGECQK